MGDCPHFYTQKMRVLKAQRFAPALVVASVVCSSAPEVSLVPAQPGLLLEDEFYKSWCCLGPNAISCTSLQSEHVPTNYYHVQCNGAFKKEDSILL